MDWVKRDCISSSTEVVGVYNTVGLVLRYDRDTDRHCRELSLYTCKTWQKIRRKSQFWFIHLFPLPSLSQSSWAPPWLTNPPSQTEKKKKRKRKRHWQKYRDGIRKTGKKGIYCNLSLWYIYITPYLVCVNEINCKIVEETSIYGGKSPGY